MKRYFFVVTLLSFVFLFLFDLAWADPPDTMVLRTGLLPANEVPPVTNLTASGSITITLFVNRDDQGFITSGTVDFDVSFSGFPAGTRFTGLHIHNGGPTIAGPVVIGTNLGSGANSVLSETGTGKIFRRVVVDGSNRRTLNFLRGVASQPQLYYVNLHTTVNPGGAIRGQLAPTTLVFRTLMVPDQEVPPVAGFSAFAVTTTTIYVNRDSTGTIVSGTVDLNLAYQFPESVTIIGYHIHRGTAGTNGPAIISSGSGSGNNSVTTPSRTGNLFRRVDIPSTDAAGLAVLNGMIEDPSQFYVNLHTPANPGGAIRGQLSASTYTFFKSMHPLFEVPPIDILATEGQALITAQVNRDETGNITSGSVLFNVDFSVPAPMTFVGLHIHNAPEGINGPVVINSGLSASNSVTVDVGTGNITRTVTIDGNDAAALDALKGALEFPQRYYVNLHTTVYPGGLLRAQLDRTVLVHRVAMRPDNEVPPVTGLNANAAATVTARLAKNAQGKTISGTVDFDVSFQFPAPATFTGLHIHNGPASISAPVVISSGIGSGANSVTDEDGVGVLFRRATIGPSSAAGLSALDDMQKNPELYYINLHTPTNPGGAVRAQLATNVHQFAQVGAGNGSSTSITLTNPSATTSASGFVFFFAPDGKPQDAIVNDASVPFVIPPSGSVTLATNSQSAVRAGYARVVSPDVVIPNITFLLPGLPPASGGASTQDAFTFHAPVSRSTSEGREAGVAVANVSTQTVRVVFSIVDAGGRRPRAGRTSVILAPGEQFSRLLGELFPELEEFQGTLRIAALAPFPSKSIIVTVVQFGPDQFSIVPLTLSTKTGALETQEGQ
ncbi:MAG: CHRD domain-containing protein [Acidobacteria bacterium]|nr:CHRD domain-containing protein [Acidobacteriota bacterium]